MPETTSAPTGTHEPRTVVFRSTASDGHRVIYHEPICPDCGSFEIIEDEIDTGDGINELGLICEDVRHRLAGRLRRGLGHPRTQGSDHAPA